MKKILLIISISIFLASLTISSLIYFKIETRNNSQIDQNDSNGIWIYPNNSNIESVKKVEIVSGILKSVSIQNGGIQLEIEKINLDETFAKEVYKVEANVENNSIPVEVWKFDREGATKQEEISYEPSFIENFISFRVEIELESNSLYSNLNKINRFTVYED